MSKARILLIVLFVLLYVTSLVKVAHKARRGKGAFVRQAAYSEMIDRQEVIYDNEDELYPNTPMMLLIQKPFHAMGDLWGSISWLSFKYLLILFIFWTVMTVARNHGPPWPDWALVVLLALNVRVFSGDLTHANVNLVTGGLIGAALLCSFNEKVFLSGVSIGCATALRVTPGLFVVYFMYKRRWISLAGSLTGIVLFGWLVPGLILGYDYNSLLVQEWYKQMIHPFFTGGSSGIPYNINQSFYGLFHRLLTDTVAIKANINRGYEAVSINFLSLDCGTASAVVKMGSLLVVGCLALFCRTPSKDHKHLGNLGEYGMVFLATLFISPRSWKHHYVMIILAHGFILYYLLVVRPSGWKKWVPLFSLIFASACFLLFSDSTVGHYWSNVAEAYGVYVIGGLSLFAGCAAILHALRIEGWPVRPMTSEKAVTGVS